MDKRIGHVLRQVAPGYHGRRQQLAHRQVNPVPYYAQYCGHKMHIDQNEKLVMYGATHVLAIDGYSGFILGLITMPVKNNLIIYYQLFRPILLNFGLWDQIRADHGREFFLLLYVQEHLTHLRRNQRRAPHVQSMSREVSIAHVSRTCSQSPFLLPMKQNRPAERIWVEVNQRVNYPIKQALNALVQLDQLNMEDDIVRFCFSWLTMRVCQVGIERCVLAWNHHPIPGIVCVRDVRERVLRVYTAISLDKGIPRDRVQVSEAVRLQAQDVPSVDDAVQSYEGEGGNLSRISEFGVDRIRNDHVHQARLTAFTLRFSNFL